MRGGRRFTVYDVMEAKGVFEENPANAISPRYAGAVEYPKMFYHPKGKMREVQKAEVLQTPYGPAKVGEQFELINRVVHDAEEEKRIRAAGWHDHPAKSIAASGAEAPPMADHNQVEALERQLAILQSQLALARAAPQTNIDEFGEVVAPSIAKSSVVIGNATPSK